MPTPIVITLYANSNNEDGVTYTKKIVSWGLLKRALRLGEALEPSIDADAITKQVELNWLKRFNRWMHRNDRKISTEEQLMDRISEFVVDVFDQQFTVKQLEDGAESSEIMTVLQSIIARAQLLDPTKRQTIPPSKKKRG